MPGRHVRRPGDLFFQLMQGCKDALYRFDHGVLAAEIVALLEVAELQACGHVYLPRIRRKLAADQRKQRGLARAVAADQADALAAVDVKAHVFNDHIGAVCFCQSAG